MRRASNVVDLMSLLPQLHDPWSELLLLRSCLGIFKVFFSLRTCQPVHMEVTALFFDKGLRDLIVEAFYFETYSGDSHFYPFDLVV
ncbi:reverse transcriptase domain-containing protein [Artemisia annua]|uniref:Reverse transcriptase domain-containing protein n=1 Tax=Artemisia annua TaxID=35608 RepID=A0A2U1M069_ARTAN|nr:reverse transcriptase domain-containing protein [Artemisia annua]